MTAYSHTLPITKTVCIVLLLVLLLIFFQLDLSAGMPHPIGSTDLVLFWVAGKLFINGQSPYNGELYLSQLVEQGLKINPNSPPLFWNAPWIFSIIVIFPLLTLEALSKTWLIISCSIYLLCFTLSKNMSRISGVHLNPESRGLVSIVCLSFFPCLLCLWLGQLSPLMLLFLTLWLKQEFKHTKSAREHFLSGMTLSLTVFKPHLVYLLWIDTGIRNLRQKNISWFLGFISGLILLNLIPLIIAPSVYQDYANNLQNAPIYWKSPTLTSFLASYFHIQSSFIKLLPSTICAIVVTVRAIRRPVSSYDYLLLLVPLSVLTSPYGWVYDFVLFIPALVHYSLRSRVITYVLIICNLMMFLSPSYEMSNYFWYPVVFSTIALLNFTRSTNLVKLKAS